MDTSSRAAIMKRDVVSRVSYTEAQRETLLDEFEHSGLKGGRDEKIATRRKEKCCKPNRVF